MVGLARTGPQFERATVAEATGLTPQAVSKVLARLAERRAGRPAGVRRPRRRQAGRRLPNSCPDSRYAIGRARGPPHAAARS